MLCLLSLVMLCWKRIHTNYNSGSKRKVPPGTAFTNYFKKKRVCISHNTRAGEANLNPRRFKTLNVWEFLSLQSDDDAILKRSSWPVVNGHMSVRKDDLIYSSSSVFYSLVDCRPKFQQPVLGVCKSCAC